MDASNSLSRSDYMVAVICPMDVEFAPVEALLDETHPALPTSRDQNAYTLGRVGKHNIVVAVMPQTGNNSAATVATQLLNDFPSIRFSLLVGIGGGVPGQDGEDDVRLGDIVVSQPTSTFGGVVQYDMGKVIAEGVFERTGLLGKPPAVLRANVEKLKSRQRREGSQVSQYLSEMVAKYPLMADDCVSPGTRHDQLFQATYSHQGGPTCRGCDMTQLVQRPERRGQNPRIHYGTIGSANAVIKDSATREWLKQNLKIICVEMEAAGLMDTFPCLVIRGICDYADTHKNKQWQPYAAAVAAAYMKELLLIVPPQEVAKESHAVEVTQKSTFQLGLNLFDAPDIGSPLFVGRDSLLKDMARALQPESNSSEQRTLILGGVGGIGKTQLAIAYTKRHKASYTSIFWLNATSETKLKGSLRTLARRILPLAEERQFDDERIQVSVAQWLSEQNNTRWLLVFDNYDEPGLYDIKKHYPYASHGSVIITTRVPEQVNGVKIKVSPLSRVEESLRILETRSERHGVGSDPGARRLAERLDGFPLALATAGAFLKLSAVSFAQYLQQYEAEWDITPRRHTSLPEYRERTLYTTWDLSFVRIKDQDPDAAKLLTFLAYFDNQDIWYELLLAGANTHANRPTWFTDLTSNAFTFEGAMRTLVEYCFVEAHPSTGSYSMHVCVHDWTLNSLNSETDPGQYWLAFDCVAGCADNDDWGGFRWLQPRRPVAHAMRLVHDRFATITDQDGWEQNRLVEVASVGYLLDMDGRYNEAKRMWQRALTGYEKELGPDHKSTLSMVNNMGTLYEQQDRMEEAEKMCHRALTGYEKALRPDHIRTLNTLHNLGYVYAAQGRMEAERLLQQALTGYEKALGPDHIRTLDTLYNLGRVYAAQGRMKAERLLQRALTGYEKALGPDHIRTLNTLYNLGRFYAVQGRMEAERLLQRALTGYEKALGPDHIRTLNTLYNLGRFYAAQGRMEAEQMLERALKGFEKMVGFNHPRTQDIGQDLQELRRVIDSKR